MRQLDRISRDLILAHLPFFEGVVPPALPVEGATRASGGTSEARLRGRLRRLMPVEGATRAPVIEGGPI